MRIRKRSSGSAATPALLSLIMVVLVAVTVYVFASKFCAGLRRSLPLAWISIINTI